MHNEKTYKARRSRRITTDDALYISTYHDMLMRF